MGIDRKDMWNYMVFMGDTLCCCGSSDDSVGHNGIESCRINPSSPHAQDANAAVMGSFS